ncbi:protease/lipase ABC transporter permease/ATP-binding protein [Roseobacter cerasinus]|uniref:Protease/lipase ABC transporter permease/ATP-binding protein n=1 Tax=Roseobacter cerasinus TaxID=2602289 RepID=A0A640VPY8_9RHOB|nr:type I secretion system permease/ATPase [Roseobacter cerasinus]GFE49520.1 protease/lipase ABC transporter permease/ATP-binding protein [Roseobacter cerasinus]
MQTSYAKIGAKELRTVRRRSRGLYWAVALFSLFANLLMLTGPLYMLQVYDRVLGSGSQETLLALSMIVIFMYAIMGLLDYTRGRVMARVGARFQSDLDRRVFDAVIRKSVVAPDLKTQTGLADLESVQRLMTSPVLMAAFDLPWTPVFFAGIFLFHPILGYFAVGGAVVLILIALANQLLSREPQAGATHAGHVASQMSDQIRNESEMVQSMGMRDAAFSRWQTARGESLGRTVQATDVTGLFTSLTKSLRLLLQSAMLGIGAYLVLQNQMTAGAMIAGSILLGRALAPVELALNQWPVVQRAFKGWDSLSELLGAVPEERDKTPLPAPKAKLAVKLLSVVPPGDKQASLKSLSFEVKPGQAVGVIGPSGAGKSTLARALTGAWAPTAGSIRLDGATLDQYAPHVLGQHIGYLPQRVQLFDGTITENIARLENSPDPEQVVIAAKKAAAHQMILDLPNGYDTVISSGQSRLSGGQMQRIGLARALYRNPVIVVLDEPNSNLDNEGSQALNMAIRSLKKAGSSVLIMAHRPAAIQECDLLLVLDNGMRAAFGPKEEVLASMVKNHQQIKQAPAAAGGVS